jgi:hypothetical protein
LTQIICTFFEEWDIEEEKWSTKKNEYIGKLWTKMPLGKNTKKTHQYYITKLLET